MFSKLLGHTVTNCSFVIFAIGPRPNRSGRPIIHATKTAEPRSDPLVEFGSPFSDTH